MNAYKKMCVGFSQHDRGAQTIHDMNSRAATLKIATALLSQPNLPLEKHQEITHMIQTESEHLVALADEMYHWLAGEVEHLTLEDHDLVELVATSVEAAKAVASENMINITLEAVAFPFTLQLDRMQFRRVMDNLLNNATKYNRKGGTIVIRLALVVDANQAFAAISVADTGYGIPEQLYEKIWNDGFRANETAQLATGSGLGLAITRRIVEAHNGRIWLETSQPGQGSTFALRLPITLEN